MTEALQEIVVIGAGAKNARKIKNQYQMFLDFDGRTSLQILLDEVIGLDGDRPVYLWGSVTDLEELLSTRLARLRDRRELVLVPEKRSPVESLVFTYLEYLKRHDEGFRKLSSRWASFEDIRWDLLDSAAGKEALSKTIFYLACDTPLVTKDEIGFLIEHHRREYDLSMGWTVREGFEDVLGSLRSSGVHFDCAKSKIGFSRFRNGSQRIEARFNNFFCGKPLRIDPDLYLFAQALYDSRNLIKKKLVKGKEQKSLSLMRFLTIFRAFVRYLGKRRRRAGNRIFRYGRFILTAYFHSLGLEGGHYPLIKALANLSGFERRRPAETYSDLMLVERNSERLTGHKVGLYLSNVVGLLFDIDSDYDYEFVKSHYGRLRHEIARYYAEHGLSAGT